MEHSMNAGMSIHRRLDMDVHNILQASVAEANDDTALFEYITRCCPQLRTVLVSTDDIDRHTHDAKTEVPDLEIVTSSDRRHPAVIERRMFPSTAFSPAPAVVRCTSLAEPKYRKLLPTATFVVLTVPGIARDLEALYFLTWLHTHLRHGDLPMVSSENMLKSGFARDRIALTIRECLYDKVKSRVRRSQETMVENLNDDERNDKLVILRALDRMEPLYDVDFDADDGNDTGGPDDDTLPRTRNRVPGTHTPSPSPHRASQERTQVFNHDADTIIVQWKRHGEYRRFLFKETCNVQPATLPATTAATCDVVNAYRQRSRKRSFTDVLNHALHSILESEAAFVVNALPLLRPSWGVVFGISVDDSSHQTP